MTTLLTKPPTHRRKRRLSSQQAAFERHTADQERLQEWLDDRREREDAAEAKRLRLAGIKTFTLSDFAADKELLVEWLNRWGEPPTVCVHTLSSQARWTPPEHRQVKDVETLDQWWRDYRAALERDFQKSALNMHKPQTHAQFITFCLKGLVTSGGSVKERVQRAIIAHPELYIDAATVKAQAEAAEVERKRQLAEMNKQTDEAKLSHQAA